MEVGGLRAEGLGFGGHAPGGRCWGVASSSSSFACRTGRANISGLRGTHCARMSDLGGTNGKYAGTNDLAQYG